MSPLWLLLIVPFAAAVGYAVACFMWMADDSDARKIAMLERHGAELYNHAAEYSENLTSLNELEHRHHIERRALDE